MFEKQPAKYSHCIVSFLDLLGFKEFVEDTNNPALVSSVLKLLRSIVLENKANNEGFEIKHLCLSDSVVRCRPVPDRETATLHLFNEFENLIFIQLKLIHHGIFVRGAITHGEVFMDEGEVFGPAYQRAYELESKVAEFPRIIVDESIISDFTSIEDDDDGVTMRYAPIDVCLLTFLDRDKGRTWFLDYLKQGSFALNSWELMRDTFLREHRNAIQRKLRELPKDKKTRAKYLWLAKYHNSHVRCLTEDQFEGTGLTPRELLVSL